MVQRRPRPVARWRRDTEYLQFTRGDCHSGGVSPCRTHHSPAPWLVAIDHFCRRGCVCVVLEPSTSATFRARVVSYSQRSCPISQLYFAPLVPFKALRCRVIYLSLAGPTYPLQDLPTPCRTYLSLAESTYPLHAPYRARALHVAQLRHTCVRAVPCPPLD